MDDTDKKRQLIEDMQAAFEAHGGGGKYTPIEIALWYDLLLPWPYADLEKALSLLLAQASGLVSVRQVVEIIRRNRPRSPVDENRRVDLKSYPSYAGAIKLWGDYSPGLWPNVSDARALNLAEEFTRNLSAWFVRSELKPPNAEATRRERFNLLLGHPLKDATRYHAAVTAKYGAVYLFFIDDPVNLPRPQPTEATP